MSADIKLAQLKPLLALLRRILTEVDYVELIDNRLLMLDGGLNLSAEEAALVHQIRE